MHLFILCYLQRVCWQVRPIDDLTRSGCNAATETTEKLSYESLDALLAVLRALEKAVGPDLTPWKVGNMKRPLSSVVECSSCCFDRQTLTLLFAVYPCRRNIGSMHTSPLSTKATWWWLSTGQRLLEEWPVCITGSARAS